MKIILFDGVCNLCNHTINFIIKEDINNNFLFASLQSEFGKSFLQKNKMKEFHYTTIFLIEDDKFYTKSEAILRILERLPRYKWLKIFMFIPKPFRDYLYLFISRNRYYLFGKQKTSTCLMPTEQILDKFIGN